MIYSTPSILRLPVITTLPHFNFEQTWMLDACPFLANSCSGFWAPDAASSYYLKARHQLQLIQSVYFCH